MADTSSEQELAILARVTAWLEDAVIGLDICPFAGPVHRAEQIRMVVTNVRAPEAAIRAALREASALIDGAARGVVTTLVVVPHALDDFETYWDAATMLKEMLSESGADGILQVATMHPKYRFAGEDADSLSHYTNRSPFPIFHLLREEDVGRAVDSHPDPEGIPAANIERLQRLGAQALRKLWSGWEGGGMDEA